MTASRATYVASEHEEQATLFEWAELSSARFPELHLMFAIPNGAALASKSDGSLRGRRFSRQGAKLKAEGLKAGVPDICLPVARRGYHGLFIEMKRTRSYSLSPEQREWLARLAGEGYLAVCCIGWEEARAELVRYLEAERRCRS